MGRDLELSQLHEAWNTARVGGAHLLLVTGEPGIGKSRLAMELCRRVRAEGHVGGIGSCVRGCGQTAVGSRRPTLLRSDTLRSHIDTLDTVWRVELARLLPELLDAAQASGPRQSGDLAQRHRLFDAVNRAITAGDRPRLLIIDDLQWCDAETIELIGFVVRSGQTGTGPHRGYRPVGGDPRTSSPRWTRRLLWATTRQRTTVPLDRLDEATTATLAARLGAVDTIDPETGCTTLERDRRQSTLRYRSSSSRDLP